MRYAEIDSCEIVNGNNVGVSLYVQGCPIHCKGCFNPETWDFDSGKEWNFQVEEKILNLVNKPYIKRLSILGGEPLYENNIFDLCLLVFTIKKFCPSVKIWLWTGYTWEELQQRLMRAKKVWPESNKDALLHKLLVQIDYIIVGPFIEQEKDLTLLWRGSKNQEVLLSKESLLAGKKISVI